LILRRYKNADVLKKTHHLRSELVHSGKEPTRINEIGGVKTPVADIVDRAVCICVEVIKILIRRGAIPKWEVFDLEDNA
jgi:hypothetical protein